jgi:lipooligosaccharide transport system permease protein
MGSATTVTAGAQRVMEYHAASFRREWQSTAATALLTPLFYLAGMGIGLGSLVDRDSGTLGIPYAAFLAPALMAAQAMVLGTIESTWPVLDRITWGRGYHAMLATPLEVSSVVLGHLGFLALRILGASAAFVAVLMLFDETRRMGAFAAIPGAVLTGLAFAAPVMAFATTVRSGSTAFVNLQRFGVMPMFLFSGTFYPVSQLPAVLQPVVWVSPLWHGVDLCRGLALGGVPLWRQAAHVIVLGVLAVGGGVLAARYLARRMHA